MSRLGFLCGGDHFKTGVAGICAACTLPGLEAGRQASVHPGEKTARGNGYSDCDEGENELQH